MSSVRVRNDGRLFFDFYHRGERCRELSNLKDTKANRRKMERAMAKIDAEIDAGTFDYGRTFPGSKKATCFAEPPRMPTGEGLAASTRATSSSSLPLFAEFANTWKQEKQIEWRVSYREVVDSTLAIHLLPEFGERHIDELDRASVLHFRSMLPSLRMGRPHTKDGQGRPLAPSTINRIVGILRMIMDEAALRYGIDNPCIGIKRLKLQRTDIEPFTMDEMRLILRTIRKDYRRYLTFRFLTGVRSAEAHGLKWKHVDFERRQILIRETYRQGRTEYTKTDGSQREIHMSQPVSDALMGMRPRGYADDPSAFVDRYVFHTRRGKPINNTNFVNRVWTPLLRSLGLKYRRPYEMRHTCATLWLAAGESPEWIARQLGHTTTEMLFRTYSRYVPNVLRRDGRAFDNLVSGALNDGVVASDAATSADTRHAESRSGGGQRA